MSMGNFKETGESSETSEAAHATETNETKDAGDNTEKRLSQILETPDEYDDDFDEKLDDCESDQDSPEQVDKNPDSSSEKGEEKQGLFNKIADGVKTFFSKKEGAEAGETKADEGTEESEAKEPTRREKFLDSVRVDDYQAPDLDKAKSDSSDRPDGTSEGGDVSDSEHGEDGQRTRYSDAQYAKAHETDER